MWGLALFGILFYRIGRSFFRLAISYGKNAWGYAIWGVASYFVGLFFILILASVPFWLFKSPEELEYTTTKWDAIIGYIGFLLAFLACWFNYRYLKNKWANKKAIVHSDLLDENF